MVDTAAAARRRRRDGSRVTLLICRGSAVAFATAVFLWASVTIPILANWTAVATTAEQILQGHPFRPEALRGLLAEPATPRLLRGEISAVLPQRSSHLRDRAILAMALAEGEVTRGDEAALKVALPKLQSETVAALSSQPADAFLWLMLYWAKSGSGGVNSHSLPFLERSYELGANEGWIALRRLRLSLSAWPVLSPDLQTRAIAEFRGLVGSGFEMAAAEIAAGADPRIRPRLIAAVDGLSENRRRNLADNLVRQGVLDLDVPGIARAEARPWM